MVSAPPDELKSVKPFLRRGTQCAAVEPVITYYCYFYAVQHIIAHALHKASPQCAAYTAELMDDLEQRKEALKQTESGQLLDDDMAAQAYVENFATKVFANANRQVEQRTATAKTADSLEAASVFLDLLNVFKPEGDEALAKQVKYCKYHAARILKALREGSDPNPPPPPPTETAESPDAAHPPAPSVEEVPDEPSPAPPPLSMSLHDEPGAESRSELPSFPSPPADASDMPAPSEPSAPSPVASVGGGYFPPPPASAPSLHDAEPDVDMRVPTPSAPSLADVPQSPPAAPPHPDPYSPAPSVPRQPPPQATWEAPSVPFQPAPPAQNPYQPAASVPVQPAPAQQRRPPAPEDIAKAQKFAKWAISALDYEDIDNAILQFRNGLAALGAL